jgi:tetratricopeptide (TPR) repeat protein
VEAPVEQIYDLLESDPIKALALSEELMSLSNDRQERDSISWARGYVLVKLGRFGEAKRIWESNFDLTGDHKALHQIGMVEREAGNFDAALKIYKQERRLIKIEDRVAVCANLYELALCSFMAGKKAEASKYFVEYENFVSEDPIERGCFYRLKGDLFKETEIALARSAYERSLEFFQRAGASFAAQEVESRLKSLRD